MTHDDVMPGMGIFFYITDPFWAHQSSVVSPQRRLVMRSTDIFFVVQTDTGDLTCLSVHSVFMIFVLTILLIIIDMHSTQECEQFQSIQIQYLNNLWYLLKEFWPSES